ncbi:PREDICTED: uncharacterized protein LOC105972143 [Erythranthe guttata]|uniref:uncharacterized protein LOC105972143 n=1 Tax=Erythranthe guttata TaxID=4155 RepID=UPI00064DCC96|nr:PREDICTED: uncharacterized protein LOC105972143 [Erythranthe guttata]|eukprot:XP_012852538.1 PREDICTED: uncharacterized protein LOC105972143 [Erythranthe guttata]
MGWELRQGMQRPDYGDDPTDFTIQMHHGGYFADIGSRCYVGGKIDHFDHCNSDMMSMREMHSMSVELGLVQPGDNNVVIRVVGVFVEHVKVDELVSDDGDGYDIEEGNFGDDIDNEEPIYADDYNEMETNTGRETTDVSAGCESDVEQSFGEDTDYSDRLHDSEYDDGQSASASKHNDAYPLLFNPEADMDDPKFVVGLCFASTDIFRAAVRRHSMKHGRDVTFKKNDPDRVRVICKDENCEWMVYASNKHGENTMQVNTVGAEHSCSRQNKVSAANSIFLAKKYHDHIRTNPSWPIKSMMTVAQKECHLEFSRFQLYRARIKGLEQASGGEDEQFSRLWDYGEEIRETNPDTTVKIKTHIGEDNVMRFQRMYICWGVLKMGFLEGCRPLIGLDGCHLKGPSGGILLAAVGVDGNNSMYPFAYAIVEKEKTSSWLWFLELLTADSGIGGDSYNWTIMSDKQKGLVEAVANLLPDAEHMFCVLHLYNNFKLSHRGLRLKELLWRAATSTRIVDFNAAMDELKSVHIKAFQWLSGRSPQHWSISYFSTSLKCDMLLNNLCESFNGMIIKARDHPIISMLELIRLMLMKRIHQQRDLVSKSSSILCPKIQFMVDELKKKAMEYMVEWNGHDQFEVIGAFHEKYTVHLGEKTCSCRKWDLSGIPCKHAIAGMFYMHYKPEDYVVDWYKKDVYLKAYSRLMNPMRGPEVWPKSTRIPLHPPLVEKLPGRPKKIRRKQPGEEITTKEGKKKLVRRNKSNSRAREATIVSTQTAPRPSQDAGFRHGTDLQ